MGVTISKVSLHVKTMKSEEAVWEVDKTRMVRKMQKDMSELKEYAAEKIRNSGCLCRQLC